MPKIFFAEQRWDATKTNPFSYDGLYGENWSAFIYDKTISSYKNHVLDAKLYSLTVNPEIDKNYDRLNDFIYYEMHNGRNVIVKASFDLKNIIKTDNCDLKTIRSDDPRWVVHSTTYDSWHDIKQMGRLLSPNMLRKLGKEINEIGLKPLIEPSDYSDYIMLDVLNGCGELVVNSRNLGYVCTEPNISYSPGIRIYFDMYEIIHNGLAVRDGLHILKVLNELPLYPYMKMSIDKTMLAKQSVWTPTDFTSSSNEYFLNNL